MKEIHKVENINTVLVIDCNDRYNVVVSENGENKVLDRFFKEDYHEKALEMAKDYANVYSNIIPF